MRLDKYTLALAQIAPRLGDLEANRDLMRKRISDACALGADLLVFPELSLTGYFLKDQVPAVALRTDSEELKWLGEASRKLSIVAGMVEESPEFLFHNAALYFEGGELLHTHRKCYLPTYGLFDEQRYFARGHRIAAFESRFGRIAALVCEDMWHPASPYIAAADGALSLICVSSSPISGVGKEELPGNARYWKQLTRFHAETWGIYVAYCNRVGYEDGVGFWGGSELLDPFGNEVCGAPLYEEALVVGEVDLAKVRRKRIASTLLRDEDLDLAINELSRIRGRAAIRPARQPALAQSRRLTRRRGL